MCKLRGSTDAGQAGGTGGSCTYLEVVCTSDFEIGDARVPPELGVQGVALLLGCSMLAARSANRHVHTI